MRDSGHRASSRRPSFTRVMLVVGRAGCGGRKQREESSLGYASLSVPSRVYAAHDLSPPALRVTVSCWMTSMLLSCKLDWGPM
jgi:hypothetical protein